MVTKKDPLFATRMGALRAAKTNWLNVRTVMSNRLAEILLMKKFFETCAKGDYSQDAYSQAIEGLPDDDPDTKENEEITEEGFHKIAEKFFKKDWDEIAAGMKNIAEGDGEEEDNYIATLAQSVREAIGYQQYAQSEADAVEGEMKDLEAANQSSS